ncbi:hypothetical protein Gpo141_00012957 [Globisporangium polare]
MNDVDEDSTSQLCNCCHGKVVPIHGEGGAWRFTECDAFSPATYMRKPLNRDVNAALNIAYIFTAETLHGGWS